MKFISEFMPVVELASRMIRCLEQGYSKTQMKCPCRDIPGKNTDVYCTICCAITGRPAQPGLCAFRMAEPEILKNIWTNIESFELFNNQNCIIDNTSICPYYKNGQPNPTTCTKCRVPNYTCPECDGTEWKHYLTCSVWKTF